jgi:tetratricopeptide (TPR) repeat protein
MKSLRNSTKRLQFVGGVVVAAALAVSVVPAPISAPAADARPGGAATREPSTSSDIRRTTIPLLTLIFPGPADAERNWPVEVARQQRLEADHRHLAALANARRLLADSHTTSAESQWLLGRVAFNLFNLDRVDEGIACFDRQLRDAVDDPARHLQLLEAKALLVVDHVEPAQGIPACRAFRQAAAPRSDQWATATACLALELARDAQHRESIVLRRELLTYHGHAQPARRAGLLIEIAKSQQALALFDEAHASLDEAEAALSADAIAAEAPEHINTLHEQIGWLRHSIVMPRIRQSRRPQDVH